MDYRVLSLGLGVQSTALYLLGLEGRVEFNWAVNADPGDEPAAVYRHLDWLIEQNGIPILVRGKGYKLGDTLLTGTNGRGGRFASIPAFTRRPDGDEGITRRMCTKEFKTEVIDKAIRREILMLKPRQRVPRGMRVIQLIGISLDEKYRAGRIYKRFVGREGWRCEFPLLDMGWTRNQCLEYLRERVPHTVQKSACVYCPYRSNAEWRWLKENDPAGWERAVAVDTALRVPGNVVNRNIDQPMYLHRSLTPLRMVDLTEKDTLNLFSAKECQGVCGV